MHTTTNDKRENAQTQKNTHRVEKNKNTKQQKLVHSKFQTLQKLTPAEVVVLWLVVENVGLPETKPEADAQMLSGAKNQMFRTEMFL